MQPAKDSFYMAMHDRLAVYDPQRTVTLDGVTRPAILVLENEQPEIAPPLYDAFCLSWGTARFMEEAHSTLMAMDCSLSYRTRGTVPNGGLDRGRALAALDCDLLAICSPPRIAKCDYSSGTPTALGSTVFWTQPVMNGAKATEQDVGRNASITVLFYPEVNQP